MVSNNVAWAIGKGYRAFQHEDVFRHRRLGHRDVPDCEISLTPGATSPRPWSAGACSRFSRVARAGELAGRRGPALPMILGGLPLRGCCSQGWVRSLRYHSTMIHFSK